MADGGEVWFAKRRFGWSQPTHWKGLALMFGALACMMAFVVLLLALIGPSGALLVPVGIVAVAYMGLVEKHSARDDAS